MEDRGVEVVEQMDVFDRLLPEVIGATVADARLHACAGHPEGEAVGVVVADERGRGLV